MYHKLHSVRCFGKMDVIDFALHLWQHKITLGKVLI